MQMQFLTQIKLITVQSAIYYLNDDKGHPLVLLVNYAENSFLFEQSSVKFEKEFLEEARQFAKGLLARKHGVNLAKREQFI